MDQPICDLQTVFKELFKARTKWYSIGLALGVDNETLTAIGREHREKDEECLRELLAHHLKMSSLTWRKLCEVLEGTTVGRKNVADEIRRKFKDLNILDNDNSGTRVPGSECTNNTSSSSASPGFRKRKRQASDEEKTQSNLNRDVLCIEKKYMGLLYKTRLSLKTRILPQELSTFLIKKFQISISDTESRHCLATADHWEVIKKAESIDAIFGAINRQTTFLDYDILEDIIEVYGEDTDRENLAKYIENLEDFLESWKVQPQKIVRTERVSEDNQTEMRFKLQSMPMVKCFQQLKKTIKKIFAPKNECTIVLVSIGEGCVELIFLIPKLIAERSIPLTLSQKTQLAEMTPSVIRVTVNGQPIFQRNGNKSQELSEELESSQVDVTEEKSITTSMRSFSPLMEAAESNHVEKVQVLIKQYGPELEIPTLNEAFLLAVEKGHTEIVKILHSCGANTSTVTEDEQTALMIAAAAEHTPIVEYFLEREEAKPEMKQNPYDIEEKAAALSIAIENGHLEIVKKLLQSYFGPAVVDTMDSDGMTPLMRAVYRKLPMLVSIIAEAGAELDLMNNYGETALMLAAESGQRSTVEILLTIGYEKGEDINLQQKTTGKTALHLASENGHLGVVEELVKPKYKADVVARDKDGKTAHDVAKSDEIKELLKWSGLVPRKQTFLEKIFTFPKLKLISACKTGNLEQVKACIKAGVKPNYIDRLDPFGWTGLMWASQNGHAEVVKFLLDNKADPNLKTRGSWTALILAARKAHYKVVEHLINNGADVLIQNWQGWSALMWAVYCPGKKNQTEEALRNRVKTAEILIAKDPKLINIPAKDQWTPLIQASMDGNAELVELLTRKKGAKTEHQTKRHWTALMLAVKHNKVEVVRALVKGGAKVDYQNPDGMSALHIACVKGHTECLERMIEPQPGAAHKINLDVKNKWGMTPLMLATKHGNMKAVVTLINDGTSVNVNSEKVLKAISSTAEASADTTHELAEPQPTVSPTQEETLDLQSERESDKSVTLLTQLEKEAMTPVESKASASDQTS